MYDEHEKILLESFFDGLRPIPRLSVSEWANKYRMLNQVSSAEPGPYRFERTPFNRKIMDCLSKGSDYTEIIWMKGAQIGATEAGNNWIGYTMHIDPGPMLLVMPNKEAIEKNSKTRIQPMIEATPVLSSKVSKAGDRNSSNTITNKEFPGGVLMMVGAGSPTGLSSTPVGKIFLDEVDRYPLSSGDEGSPVELARARARTFADKKKIYVISTPTNEGTSVIANEFEKTDMQYYNVPCIHCDELFIITWECITWNDDDPDTARCACPNCGGLHENRHKSKMLPEKGYGGKAEWIATAEIKNKKKIGFHLSGLYSPPGQYSWSDAVDDYLKALKDEHLMQTFTNTVLGETFKVVSEIPNKDAIYDRRENYEIGIVPKGVYFLTMGADIQGDRIEYDIVGWGKGRESWDVKYDVIMGDTSKNEVWNEFSEVINSQIPTHDGLLMSIRLTAVDAGYRSSKVYDLAKKHGYGKVIPIQGKNQRNTGVMVSPPKKTTTMKSGKKMRNQSLWMVDTYMLKEELYSNLRLTSNDEGYPPGYCHFPMYDKHYFQMLTAEEFRLKKNSKGYDEWQWVKVFDRNEVLDIRCYARAAAYILGIDRFKDANWDKMKEISSISPEVEEVKVKSKKKKRESSWLK